MDGLLWEKDGEVGDTVGKSNFEKTNMKEEHGHRFATPLDSFLVFLPVSIWEKMVFESNRKAHQQMDKSGKNEISGSKWVHDICLQELMTFIGILILMVLDPVPGRCQMDQRKNPQKYPYVEHMTQKRF